MHSKLYDGFVEHERFYPAHHRLRYNLSVYALDLAELETLQKRLPFFGYNRRRPVCLLDRDYLDSASGSIRTKLLKLVSADLPTASIDQIFLVTSPRLMGYVFNPVSFYYCFSSDGRLLTVVAEVNNTFGEKHVYVLPSAHGVPAGYPVRFTKKKAFHVSPFNSMDGTYDFSFSDIREELDIRIDLNRNDRLILRARLVGRPHPLTPVNHLKTLVRHPVRPHLTIPRIYWEAFNLRFRRNLAYHGKPVPRNPATIRRLPPTPWERRCRKLLLSYLRRARRGRLEVSLPDGTRVAFGEAGRRPNARMRVNAHSFFSRTILGADIGLGEAFVREEWDTDNIPAVLGFFIQNRDVLKDGSFLGSMLMRVLEKLRYMSRANTPAGSRHNIRQHYDLSNTFFQTFLDDTMTYSCAMFSSEQESLEAAQRRKYRCVIEKARLGSADHVLEIGCGWGGFALEAVQQTGCRVTGITISREQWKLARERVRQAGLQDRIRILFRDYRQMRGQFDKIVSIEMLEAVGHAYFQVFFRQLDRLLAPRGIAVIQTITIPDQRYEAYRKTHDWIQKYIFPGGLLPSLTLLTQTMTRHTRLMVDHAENIGNHYATTLACWQRRFQANRDRVSALGFDRVFQRTWSYYLGSCEAGFRERVLGNLQLVLTREANPRLAG